MADPSAVTQTVPSSDSSSLRFVGDWQLDPEHGFSNISCPSAPASVVLTFHGIQADVLGFMSFGDTNSPLRGSISSSKTGSSSDFAQPASGSQNGSSGEKRAKHPSVFYTTDPLPCDQHSLTLNVGPDQTMQIEQFDFIPCLEVNQTVSSSTAAPTSTSNSTDTISALGKQQQRPLGAGAIAGIVLGSLFFLILLSGAILFILLRRQRNPRSFPRPTPTLAHILGSASPSFGTGPFVSVSKSAPASIPAFAPASEALAVTTVPGMVDGLVEKPPLGPDDDDNNDDHGRRGADLDELGGHVVRGYLPDSKEWIASQEREQQQKQEGEEEGSTEAVLTTHSHTVESLPRYELRTSLPRS
ncbi:hypothetical protein B0F90DRAFT_1818528 [Multifurca ochricompacta]|uniref:Uncharacterized protein n=1 Tax=Multifurca ochricompacta TaxID=376703 RepID=A0AAD4M1F1_9AGAM|nr:hypothetical protein B0F90DRAFT_1818528 [Multifurca ochricompacta]